MLICELFEAPENMVIKNHMRNYHNDQADMTLYATIDDKMVGYIEYSVFRGVPSIQMIKVTRQREGIGTALLQQLQREFPGVEIDWGFTTPMGTELKKAVPTERVPHPEVIKKQKKLQDIKDTLKQYEKIVADWRKSGSKEETREKINAMVDNWNDLTDEEYRLEQELAQQKAYTTLIKT